MGLFGTSGVRGKVNEYITPELALNLGKAIGTFVNSGKVCVGWDVRTSSILIKNALIAGLLDVGCDVTEIGLVPTPVLAFTTTKGFDAGVMITASHNPPEYNGIKVWSPTGKSFDKKDEDKMEEIFNSQRFSIKPWNLKGKCESYPNAINDYIDTILKKVGVVSKDLKVVIDCGNGATSVVAPLLLREAGCKVISINSNPDGYFSARDPEPTKDSLEVLAKVVKDSKSKLGAGYDGDGDRAVFIDDNGEFIPLDVALAIVSKHILKERPGKIVTTVDASMLIEEYTQTEVIRTKVGDVYVAEELAKHKDAVFGGEPCGAWIFPQFSLCPDGILSSLIMCKIAEENNLSEFVSRIPTYPMRREKIPCQNKEEIMKKLLEKVKELGYEYIAVDGVRIKTKNGWVLIRPSGTEPIMRITAEGDVEKLVSLAKDLLEEVKN